MLKSQKMSDIAPRTSSLEGSLAKMLGKTYSGDVPAHEYPSVHNQHHLWYVRMLQHGRRLRLMCEDPAALSVCVSCT